MFQYKKVFISYKEYSIIMVENFSEVGKLEKYGESTVKRALIRLYTKKFENLPEKERDEKIASAIAKTVPTRGGQVAEGITSFGYAIGKSLPSKDLGKLSSFIDNECGYRLIIDSFSEGLEPVYFWVLDFMRDNYWGTGLDVNKILDEFQGSIGSGQFGDMGTRASIMQDRAMKLIQTINTVVRSIINILYDLKEFDQRLDLYNKLKSSNKDEELTAKLGLKQVWMDKVDIQRGRGSINMLAQQLQFVTLRDAFMAANREEEAEKFDLNDRVKRILKPRIQEYNVWEKLSEAELRRRYNIEKSYLRSQVDSLKLYSQWAKPYLKAAQRLASSDYSAPDLVSMFNNMLLQVSLFGKKEVRPADIYKPAFLGKNRFANIKIPKKIYQCLEVSMEYRTIPHTMTRSESGLHYVQGGKIKLTFRGFGLDEDEVKAVEKEEIYQGLELIQGITTTSLEQMQEEIDKYLKADKEAPKDIVEKEKFIEERLNKAKTKKEADILYKELKQIRKTIEKSKKDEFNPVTAPFEGLKEMFSSLKIFNSSTESEKVMELTKQAAKKSSAGLAYTVYLIYKKSHGMMSE